MAARVIPFEDNVSAKGISITATDATPEGCILSTTQNAVTFTNNSGYVIDINFNPSGIFTNVIGLSPTSPNNSNTQSAPANTSVNYNVTVYETPQVTNGPFAIQRGTGYMVVTVSGSGDNLTNVPVDVAIPVGGNLMMYTSSNNVYPVAWTDGDPFDTDPITTVDNAVHTGDPVNGGPDPYPYQVGQPGPNNNPGAGTVIVRGT